MSNKKTDLTKQKKTRPAALSRREALGLGGAALAGAAIATTLPASAQKMDHSGMHIRGLQENGP